MRIGVGGYFVCVNSFSPNRTDLSRCQRTTRIGAPALAAHRRVPGAVRGFCERIEGDGHEVVPLPFVAPGLHGPIEAQAQAWVEAQFSEALAADRALDGIFVQLHGGGAGIDGEDCEGRFCAVLRECVGDAVPIVAVLDGHANISERLFEVTDVLIAAKTNPHYDFYERGKQAAAIMARLVGGQQRVHTALAQPPLLPSLQKQRIAAGWPWEDLVRRAKQRSRDQVLDVTVIGGWPYADCPHAGLSVMVATEGSQALADDIAAQLSDLAWRRREQYQPDATPVEAAVREALEATQWPVVLGDVADSGGAATPGDGTAILRELLAQGAKDAVVGHLVDPDAVRAAIDAGVGQTVRVSVGGKRDNRHGEPVEVEGKVRALVDGDFRTSTAFNAGRQRRGPTAVLDCGGVEVILTSRTAHSFETNAFRSVGIEPSERRILVAKSEMQHRAGLEGIAHTFIDVDGPGISTPFLSRLPYRHLRRPIFPLDED